MTVSFISLDPVGGISMGIFVVQSMATITNHGLSMDTQWLAMVTLVKIWLFKDR